MQQLTSRRPLRSPVGYGNRHHCVMEAIAFFKARNNTSPTIDVDYFIYYKASDSLWYFVEIWAGGFK